MNPKDFARLANELTNQPDQFHEYDFLDMYLAKTIKRKLDIRCSCGIPWAAMP